MRKSIVCLIVAFSSTGLVFSQDNKVLQDKFLEAEYFLLNEEYQDALNPYLQLYEKLPDNANIAHCIGVCYLNIQGKKNLSISYLEAAARNISALHKEGTINQTSASYDALYDLAKAYRINYMFDKALVAYEKYSKTLLPDDNENQNFIKHEIEVCTNAENLINKPVEFEEENLGQVINDQNSNYNPILSADGKMMAWMVRLKFYDAVMFSKFVDGKWSSPVNITPELQSDGNYYLSSMSKDGKIIFLSKNDGINSDIFSSNYDGNTWSKATRLNKNINTRYWESQACVSNDGKTLIFSSDRPGGFGGLDLYVSLKTDGEWGPAINMGPEINTPFNEDRPFTINNGNTLYFSSQGHESIGGYDVFKSNLLTSKLWSKPENIGYPINTPDDNYFYNPGEDGKSLYYSLFREAGGFGKEDIYRIILK